MTRVLILLASLTLVQQLDKPACVLTGTYVSSGYTPTSPGYCYARFKLDCKSLGTDTDCHYIITQTIYQWLKPAGSRSYSWVEIYTECGSGSVSCGYFGPSSVTFTPTSAFGPGWFYYLAQLTSGTCSNPGADICWGDAEWTQ